MAAAAEPPNVLLILADDLGWNDVGYHGSEVQTPNIDTLADNGVRMERFYVTPICSPTRAGLLTGRYPDRFGLRREVIKPWGRYGLDVNEVTLADVLSYAGYTHRAVIGKWHLGHSQVQWHPMSRGFTSFYGMYTGAIDYFRHLSVGERDWHRNFTPAREEGYATELLGREAVGFVEARSADTAPWFLYLAFNAPHNPLQATEADLTEYGFDAAAQRIDDYSHIYTNPCCEQGRGNTRRQTYSAMITALDREIGAVLHTLDATGQADDTLVIFLSDNGGHENWGASNDPLRGGKHDVWEGGVRVPAIVRWPAAGLAGGVYDGVAAYVDVLPTIAAAAGLVEMEMPAILDGIDLLPRLSSRDEPPADRVVYLGARDDRAGYLVGGFAAVTQRWKIVGDVLFDLSVDISEEHDVAARYPEIAAELRDAVETFRRLASNRKAPLADDGRDGFVPPADWRIQR